MRAICLSGAMLVCCLASVYGQGKDSLTGLPVIPAAETIVAGKSYGFQPSPLPGSRVCKSGMKGDFFSLAVMNVKDHNVKVSTAASWYAANLAGFKKVQGFISGDPKKGTYTSQTIFYNSGGTLLVIITGGSGRQGEDTTTYGVAYQRYEPGLSEKTIASMTQGKIICQ